MAAFPLLARALRGPRDLAVRTWSYSPDEAALMLWFALAVMTGLAVLAALWPLAFRRAPGFDAASEAAFYKAQLEEIDRDVERGQLPQPEAASARAEAARRLIAASAKEALLRAGAAKTPRAAAPPRRSFSSSFRWLRSAPISGPGVRTFPTRRSPRARNDPNSPDAMDAMIAQIEGHLAASPDDAKGWSVLAPVYMQMGRYDDAAEAFRQLLRLKGENGELRADYGEALVAAGGAIVTADARASFEKALAETPGLPKARFYLALAAEQDGETKKAIEQYQSMLDDAKGDAPWKDAVAARLAALKGEPAPGRPEPRRPRKLPPASRA